MRRFIYERSKWREVISTGFTPEQITILKTDLSDNLENLDINLLKNKLELQMLMETNRNIPVSEININILTNILNNIESEIPENVKNDNIFELVISDMLFRESSIFVIYLYKMGIKSYKIQKVIPLQVELDPNIGVEPDVNLNYLI